MTLLDDFFLDAHPNPERRECPDERTLKGLADGSIADADPARLHLAKCSECYAEFKGYQFERARKLNSRTRIFQCAIAASLLLACGLGVLSYHRHLAARGKLPQLAQSNVIRDSRVNLFNSGTLRGAGSDTQQLQEVTLPAAIVRLHVILPRFSEAGRYSVRISNDKLGGHTVAEGSGEAAEKDGRVGVAVTLDLRTARPGTYFLATVRGADNGTYYYPLKIQ